MRRDHLMDNNEGTGKTKGQQISFTDEQFIALQVRVFADLEEFNRKIELRQKLKLIVNKHGINENGLDKDMKDPLKFISYTEKLKKICTSVDL